MLELQRVGFTPQGVDVVFNSRALADCKVMGALETIDEQIAFLVMMGEGSESEFINMSLEDLKRTSDSMDKMIDAWRTGDSKALRTFLIDGMRERAPRLYESLLRQRNLRWISQIELMFDDPETEFVLVGAAHLVVEDGVVGHLRAKG